MTLIAISGSQSSGKTTALNEIKKLGYNVVERKTSRSILSDWDITLEQVNNDPDLILKFQEEILKRKFEDEYQLSLSSNIWFTERTFADLATYFIVSFGKINKFSKDINDYYRKCIINQQIYHNIFYLNAGHFVPVYDNVRSVNIHYSRMVDLTMLDLTQQMTKAERLIIINTPDLEQRLVMILSYLNML